ncbi:unnamed protein product, partial [marine sediment metagenome]
GRPTQPSGIGWGLTPVPSVIVPIVYIVPKK